MIKLNMTHVNAICHAELLVDATSLTQGSHKLRAQLDNDLLRLAELKLFIIQRMAGTNKLFPKEDGPNGDPHCSY